MSNTRQEIIIDADWYDGETIKNAPRGSYLTYLKGAKSWSRNIARKVHGQELLGGGAQIKYFGPIPDPEIFMT